MRKVLKQSGVLLLSFGFVALWEFTPLNALMIPIIGLFAIGILINFMRRKKKGNMAALGDNPYVSVFLVNALVFLIVFATGGINSSLFLLLYFVGFGIAFVFEPVAVFVYLLGTAAILLPLILQDDVMGNAIKCATILVVGPLAYFFGREFKKEEAEDEAILALENEAHQKASDIEKSVVEVLEQEKEVLNDETTEKLKKILKQSDELREETKLT